MRNARDQQIKFIIATILQYIKFILALVLLWIAVSLWQYYTYVNIPLDNTQMGGDYDEKTKHFATPVKHLRYGDVVYYTYPHPSVVKTRKKMPQVFISRVVGLPGDMIKVEKGHLYRNGRAVNEKNYYNGKPDVHLCSSEVIVPRGYVYLLLDRRSRRVRPRLCFRDSRMLGPIPQTLIRAKLN